MNRQREEKARKMKECRFSSDARQHGNIWPCCVSSVLSFVREGRKHLETLPGKISVCVEEGRKGGRGGEGRTKVCVCVCVWVYQRRTFPDQFMCPGK